MTQERKVGVPFRAPCGGWKNPPLYFDPPLYRHVRAGDFGINKYVNITTVPNPAGGAAIAPYEIYNQTPQPNCTQPPTSPATPAAWIGTGQYQFTLVSGQVNPAPQLFRHNSGDGTVNFNVCYKSGFKNVAVVLQWNGVFGWLSHDPAGCADSVCSTLTTDSNGNAPGSHAGDPGQLPLVAPVDYITTYSYSTYEGQQLTPDQIKYLNLGVSASYHATGSSAAYTTTTPDPGDPSTWVYTAGSYQQDYDVTASGYGTRYVNRDSGITSSTLGVDTDEYTYFDEYGAHAHPHVKHLVARAGWTANYDTGVQTNTKCGTSVIDADIATDVHCPTHIPAIAQAVTVWNGFAPADKQIVVPPNAGGFSVSLSYDYLSYRIPGLGRLGVDFGGITAPSTTSTIAITVTRTNTGYSWSIAYAINYFVLSEGFGYQSLNYSGSLNLSGENSSATLYADAVSLLSHWPLNDDHLYPWRTDGYLQVAPLVSRLQLRRNSSPVAALNCYTVDDLRSPITDANGNAPWSSPDYAAGPPVSGAFGTRTIDGAANNDSQGRPYNTDPTLYSGAVAWVPTYTQMNWFDPDAFYWRYAADTNLCATDLVQMVDGSVQGAPNPAGYVDYFRFDFSDWRGCHTDDGSGDVNFDWYEYGYGMSLANYISATGAQLPLNATQWTNNYFAIGTPPGASLMYADPTVVAQHDYSGLANTNGALVGMKYAEIAERWPSENYGQPAGAMRFSYDEVLVFCATSISGSGTGATLTLTDASGSPQTLVDTSGIWGGAVVGGFYHITASGTTVTLGAKVYDLPTGWASRSGDDAVCFGRLRWPNAPGILGRVAVTAVTAGSPVHLALDATYLHTGDVINIYDAGMSVLASNIAITKLDDGHVTVAVAYSTIQPAAWATPYRLNDGTTDGGKYYFADAYPKGDFITLQWLFDRRTNAEYTRLTGVLDCTGTQVSRPTQNHGFASFSQAQGCVPFKPCCPAVVCISPNGETWPNGSTIAFPSSFALDERYGSRWQGYVQTTMTSIWWQPPHQPCGSDFDWKMDDGSCPDNSDTTHYYPHAPVVEARIALPANYGAAQNETPPALPTGIVLGWLSPVDHTGAGVAMPPSYIGFTDNGNPAAIDTPWALRSRLCGAAAPGSACRFAGVYAQQVVNCPNA